MNDKNTPSNSLPQTDETPAAGLTRRRLVRAGLTAAPVMAALHSNTVLAGGSKGFGHGCIRPSTFSSLQTAKSLSQGPKTHGNLVCKPHTYWQHSFPDKFKHAYFLSDVTKCRRDPKPYDHKKSYKKLKMREVFELRDEDTDARLARYVLAAVLSADAAGLGSDNVWLTKRQCHEIWNGRGNWRPFAGANWDLNQTMNYFEAVFAWG